MARKKVESIEEVKQEVKAPQDQIYDMYNTQFNDVQREAFLLGRIATLIDLGNFMSGSINDTLKNTEDVLNNVQKKMRDEIARQQEAVAEINRAGDTTKPKRKTTKKKEAPKKDE